MTVRFVMGAAAAAILLVSCGGEEAPEALLEPPAVTGEDLPPLQPAFSADMTGDRSGTRDPALGFPAPTVTGELLPGGRIQVPDDVEGPVALLFVAPWCEHCLIQLPEVVHWQRGSGDTLEVVTVVSAFAGEEGAPWWPPSNWVADVGVSSPVLYDVEDVVAARFGIEEFPSWTLLGADGEVLLRHVGRLRSKDLDALAEAAASSR